MTASIVIGKFLLGVALCLALVGFAGVVGLLIGAVGVGDEIDHEND